MFETNSEIPVLFSVECEERHKKVTHSVAEFICTLQNLLWLWNKCKNYKVVFGKEFQKIEEFQNIIMGFDVGQNCYVSKGLYYVIDPENPIGIFYINEIRPEYDALVHYIFFDRIHEGREVLVKKMLEYLFSTYKFHRLNAEIPHYANKKVREYANRVGFTFEGIKRKAAFYEDNWFNVSTYGILSNEVLTQNGIE